MNVVEIPLSLVREAPWNANRMDDAMLARLGESISRYGLVQNLVVRPVDDGFYEVLSGNQRVKALREAGIGHVPCVIVNLDDAHARILAQALNRIQGQDDLGLRAELLREVLNMLPESQVLSVLPDTASGLRGLATMGRESIAAHLQKWQAARPARLRHLQFQVTPDQLRVIEEALSKTMLEARRHRGDSPNLRGTALYLLCQHYVEEETGNGSRHEGESRSSR